MARGRDASMSPAIEGPESVSRTGSPPTFQVKPGLNRFYAVEVTTQAHLFNAMKNAGARTPDTFFASWTGPQLASGATFQLPQNVWERFRGADRLYYRLVTSASPTEWRDALASVADGQPEAAPSVQIFNLFRLPEDMVKPEEAEAVWAEAQNQEASLAVRALGTFEALVYLHRFSPRRPIAAQVAEWVVIVSHPPKDITDPVVVSLMRLNYKKLTLIADHTAFHEKQRPVTVVEATEVMNRQLPPGGVSPIKVQEVVQVGNLWVYTNQSPPPNGSLGCTLIVHRLSGILVYSATTNWHKRGVHLVP